MVNYMTRLTLFALLLIALPLETACQLAIDHSRKTIDTSRTEPPKRDVPAMPAHLGVKTVLLIVLENGDPKEAENDPHMKFFQFLQKGGTELRQYYAVAHPSQPNYIALISGSIDDVKHGDDIVVLNRPHIGQALGEKRWKVYAEDYPALSDACSLEQKALDLRGYARRHVPFLNFCDVLTSDCRQIVTEYADLKTLRDDIDHNTLPNFALLIPNLHHDGHFPSDMGDADEWLHKTLEPLLNKNSPFTKDLLVILTFDEDDHVDDSHPNQVFTVLWGDHVQHRTDDNDVYDHYDLLATLEAIFEVKSPPLPPGARPIGGVWR